MYFRNLTVLSSFFDVKKQRPKTNFEKCYQCTVNIEIVLTLHSVRPIRSLKFLHPDDYP